MALIVQKFGGSSVADAAKLRNVARIITDTYKQGNQVVAVLSAQGDTTDDLIDKAKEINPNASKREMDMLLSTGEQISISHFDTACADTFNCAASSSCVMPRSLRSFLMFCPIVVIFFLL